MARILLVEDDAINREALTRRLERRGYEVVTGVDGQEGLTLARLAQPDLILMDLSLPEIDGWEATRRLKTDPATAPIPLIILSGYVMASDRDRALEVGCDDFDTKPVDFQRLVGKIETLLQEKVRS